mmetsp:Transcript_6489/g.12601  ORF Transcript_6489/g.12601 Transcript_6489/m.12601 type:complete len:245 (-) Transcript_6489:57-791(-)
MVSRASQVFTLRPRKHLTVIPEEMRPINYWFTVVLAGTKATEFARMAVDSEFAEIHRQCASKASNADVIAASNAGGGDEDTPVLFCPIGGRNNDLARVRFWTCSGFSEALPLIRDRSAAKNLAVVLLFWQEEVASEEEEDKTANEAIGVFQTRIAEIAHLPPNCRPYTTVLSVKANANQESHLTDFRARQQQVKVSSISCEEASGDILAGSLQTLCQDIICHQRSATRKRLSVIDGGPKCCAVM